MMRYFTMSSFVAGVMVGAVATAAWFLRGNMPIVPESSLETFSPQATTSAAESGAVNVTDQVAGSVVWIETVTVPRPGVWVAVREVTGSTLGNVLGAARAAGPKSNFSVPLLRPTETGGKYAVQLYRDDRSGNFDPVVNSVYVDFDTGERVVEYFSTFK